MSRIDIMRKKIVRFKCSQGAVKIRMLKDRQPYAGVGEYGDEAIHFARLQDALDHL